MGWFGTPGGLTPRRVLSLLAAGAAFWLLAVWPPPLWYRTHWPKRTAFMALHPDGPRKYHPVPLDSIAPIMEEAVIAGEDTKFHSHWGIDYLAMAQALGYSRRRFSWSDPADRAELWSVLPRAWSRRDRLRGASTITQQLAKNLYLSPSRNPLRKVKEAVTAWRLEAALGKRRIMGLYLNVVELGDNVWGVEAASREYFDRPASRLARDEAAALAATLPFPRRSNPAHRPARMRWRQQLILRRLGGEEVEVPKVVEEIEPDSTAVEPAVEPIDAAPPGDSALALPDSAPAADSGTGPPLPPVDSLP